MNIRQAFQLAVQHHQSGRLAEAEVAYRRILAAEPRHAEALQLLGVIAHQAGHNAAAVDLIRQAIAIKPRFSEAHYNLGVSLSALGQLDEALEAYRGAIALKPDYPEAYYNLGCILDGRGRTDEAIAAYREAIALKPDHAQACINLGTALQHSGLWDESIAAYHQAIALNPNLSEAHCNLGTVLKDKGQADEAIATYHRAIQLKPDDPEVRNNLGNALKDKGLVEEAVAAYGQAIALAPDFADAHWNLSLSLLLQGNFLPGWEKYEWRWRTRDFLAVRRNFTQPQWDGGPLEGRTILVYAEQGFGDVLQFIRYLPLVARRGGRVIVECQEPLLRLVQMMGADFLAVAQGRPLPAFDVHCPLLSLPRLFATDLASIPRDVPYLRADAAEAGAWRERLADHSAALKVGLVWAGSPTFKADLLRSPRQLSLYAPLGGVEGVEFFSLQKGEAARQARTPPTGMTLHDWTDDLRDFADTAALMENLDLIISSDTSVVHLAGALGKPVWVLLPFAPDFRWLLGRSDSPWYPTMRLFRQQRAMEWEPVIAQVRAELQSLVASRGGKKRPGMNIHQAFQLAIQHQQAGRLREAEILYRQILAADPRHADALHMLGLGAFQAGRYEAAIELIRQAIASKPNYPEAYGNLGLALYENGQVDEAVAAYRQAIALKPDYPEAHGNLGNALVEKGSLDEAVAACLQAIALRRNYPEAHYNLGGALKAKGQLEQAIAAYRRAIALRPDFADAHFNLALALLLQGNFLRGWEEYEWRWRSRDFRAARRSFPQPQWDGGPLEGRTILLHTEQGFGDTLQFIRYLPLVAQRGGRVIVRCREGLRRLLQTMGADVPILEKGEPLPAFDVHCPLLSLPRLFATDLASIPRDVPYLHADAAAAEVWRDRLADHSASLKVGLVWAGSPTHRNDRNRSTKLAGFAPLARIPGMRFVSLQKGDAAAEAKSPPEGMELSDPTEELHDFADTAALVAALDLVIAVDTSVVHLAGALGKPVWVLLPFAPDWRWLLDRSDSPWYPTMRLFRQQRAGEWDHVIAEVRSQLEALAEGRS
jgi:tetratricopeptide (TPR) repeat protein